MRFAYLTCLATAVALAVCSCGGGGGGSSDTSLSQSVVSNSTGSGSGVLTTVPTTSGNSLAVFLDAKWASPNILTINVPYVSVTVCAPGTSGSTAACQTIDHVQVDTGSTGLRLLKSALSSSLTLPAVTDSSGNAIGECGVFADGYTWGSVRKADVYLAGELAANVSIQDIGDHPGSAQNVPSDCSGTGGTNENTPLSLGANGRLGVGLFVNDCDSCLTAIQPATYYTCTTSGCTGSTVTSAQVVKNPVALFAQDNNGVLMQLPAVPSGGTSSSGPLAFGALVFGIGTRGNNLLGSATVYATDQYGNFRTTYPVTALTPMNGFIDSGSNGLFFPDASIAICSSASHAPGFYCPASYPSARSATNTAAFGGAWGTVNFTLDNVDAVLAANGNVVAINVGAPSVGILAGQFDWGLPFFFGRDVFTAIEGPPYGSGPGPYFAY
jgi:hypothetical protein